MEFISSIWLQNKSFNPPIRWSRFSNDLFKSIDFVYKKKFLIKTKDSEKEYIIISKSMDYILTINGDKIYIKDIIDIKII